MITLLILLAAVGILVWGFIRARPYGKLGLLAWLQSVILMVPWLLFFGLFAAGMYLNLAGVLLLVVLSTGGYIWLGRQLRSLGGTEQMAQQKLAISQTLNQADEAMADSGMSEGQTVPTQADLSATQPAQKSAPMDEPAFTPIPAEDLTAIEGIFGIDTFFRTETTAYQSGAFFRGNLRGQPAETVNQLTTLLEDRLGDRYRLFLIEGPERKPVVVVLPSSDDPKPATTPQKVLAVALAIATVITSLETGGILQGFDFFQNFSRWGEALPVALGVVAVLTAHELGHRWQAQRHQVKLSWPFFFPAWQLGSFGAFTRFESLLPNRSVLFDVAFAGPAVGGLVSLLLLLLGLVISHPGSYFQIPAEFFQGSVLVGSLARIVLGTALQADIIDVHPLTIVGWLGLVITALNVMPAGQLDGGRMVQAIYGRRVASRATVVTLILLALVSLVNPLALYWAALILFLQRGLERPCLDDLSEPDDARAGLALLILFMMLATLLPLTPSLAGRLGIG
ncbi:MAG: site-2 protease family protein [Cyanobacteria bacterium P01_F01_bin.4]